MVVSVDPSRRVRGSVQSRVVALSCHSSLLNHVWSASWFVEAVVSWFAAFVIKFVESSALVTSVLGSGASRSLPLGSVARVSVASAVSIAWSLGFLLSLDDLIQAHGLRVLLGTLVNFH